jgi:hypothetical protein
MPITWSLYIYSLPPGLILDWITGKISGIPAMAGTFNFTVRAENAAGSVTKALSITIVGGVGTALPPGIGGKYYSCRIHSVMPPIIFSGMLPPGLTLDANTALISGTPKIAGAFNFTVRSQNFPGAPIMQMNISIINMLAGSTSATEDIIPQLDKDIDVVVSDESEASKVSDISEESKKEKSNGCNTGFGSFAFVFLVPFFSKRK